MFILAFVVGMLLVYQKCISGVNGLILIAKVSGEVLLR